MAYLCTMAGKKEDLQLQIIRWVSYADEPAHLQKVWTLISELHSPAAGHTKPVGYTPKGTPVDPKTFLKRFESSMQQTETRGVLTLEQLQVRSDQW